jgi:hypothetical protein
MQCVASSLTKLLYGFDLRPLALRRFCVFNKPLQKTEAAEQCVCPDWSDAIREKVEAVEALNTLANEKVLSSLSSTEKRLEDALLQAATNAQQVTTLQAENVGLALERAQLLEKTEALTTERDSLKQKKSELKDQVEGLTANNAKVQEEAAHHREELALLKEQVESYKSKEANMKNDQEHHREELALLKVQVESYKSQEANVKRDQELLVTLEAERSKLDGMLNKEIEQVSLLSEKARECQVLVEITQSELRDINEFSAKKLNEMQIKQNESQRRLQFLEEEGALKEEAAGKHYCNATAMRLDLDAKVIEVHNALNSKLKPHVERGLVQGKSLSNRALNEMGSQYNLHLKEHVEHSILPRFREHLAPHVAKATTLVDEGMAKVYLFLVDTTRSASLFCLDKIKHHESSKKEEAPAWLKDALEYTESNPDEFVQLYLKAAGTSVVVFLLWNLICSCFLGPLFFVIGLAVYISIEVPFHLVWFVGRSAKRLVKRIVRRTIKGKRHQPPPPPPHGRKAGIHGRNKGKPQNGKINNNGTKANKASIVKI